MRPQATRWHPPETWAELATLAEDRERPGRFWDRAAQLGETWAWLQAWDREELKGEVLPLIREAAGLR